MFNQNKWQLLQLFGGEGGASGASAAGDGGNAAAAATGENSADAGHQRLRELGVPESKIRKPRAKQASPLPEGAFRTQSQVQQQPTAQVQEPKEQAAAANDSNAQTEQQPQTRMKWDEIVKDPEYNAEIQKIVKSRLKDDGESKAILDILSPALQHLAKANGMDPQNMDYTALVKHITGEYENKALELGVSKETAMMLDQQQRTVEQMKFQNHISKLEQQGEALKAVIPNFDLRTEMQNPVFARLTSPSVGMSVEDAFYAVHRREMQAQSMQVAAQQTRQMISNAIQSGTNRPDETGTVSQAPSVSKFDYKNMTPAQRKALKDEIYRAGSEGRKIYPG
jgi:hypothetical protein